MFTKRDIVRLRYNFPPPLNELVLENSLLLYFVFLSTECNFLDLVVEFVFIDLGDKHVIK